MGMQPNKANLFSAYLSRVCRMKDESDFFYIIWLLFVYLLSNCCLLKWIKEALRGVLIVIAHALHLCRWRRTSMLFLPSPLLVMVSGIVSNPDDDLCDPNKRSSTSHETCTSSFLYFNSLVSRFANVPIIGELLQPQKQFFQWCCLSVRSLLTLLKKHFDISTIQSFGLKTGMQHITSCMICMLHELDGFTFYLNCKPGINSSTFLKFTLCRFASRQALVYHSLCCRWWSSKTSWAGMLAGSEFRMFLNCHGFGKEHEQVQKIKGRGK